MAITVQDLSNALEEAELRVGIGGQKHSSTKGSIGCKGQPLQHKSPEVLNAEEGKAWCSRRRGETCDAHLARFQRALPGHRKRRLEGLSNSSAPMISSKQFEQWRFGKIDITSAEQADWLEVPGEGEDQAERTGKSRRNSVALDSKKLTKAAAQGEMLQAAKFWGELQDMERALEKPKLLAATAPLLGAGPKGRGSQGSIFSDGRRLSQGSSAPSGDRPASASLASPKTKTGEENRHLEQPGERVFGRFHHLKAAEHDFDYICHEITKLKAIYSRAPADGLVQNMEDSDMERYAKQLEEEAALEALEPPPAPGSYPARFKEMVTKLDARGVPVIVCNVPSGKWLAKEQWVDQLAEDYPRDCGGRVIQGASNQDVRMYLSLWVLPVGYHPLDPAPWRGAYRAFLDKSYRLWLGPIMDAEDGKHRASLQDNWVSSSEAVFQLDDDTGASHPIINHHKEDDSESDSGSDAAGGSDKSKSKRGRHGSAGSGDGGGGDVSANSRVLGDSTFELMFQGQSLQQMEISPARLGIDIAPLIQGLELHALRVDSQGGRFQRRRYIAFQCSKVRDEVLRVCS